MNLHRFITVTLCLLLCGQAFAQAPSMDSELSTLADKLATQIKDNGKKKVAVLDFTDLQGGSSELGRYIAEQLTVNLVMGKRDFSVLDRANLKSILAEHKLTATGLVDPENAKKIGQFAGVDALILGTMVPVRQDTELTAKVIATDTAEIVGAARARFKADEFVQQLKAQPTAESAGAIGSGGQKKLAPKTVKTFGNLRVELEPLSIVNQKQFLLSMTLTNVNPKKSIWVALNTDIGSNIKGTVTDAEGVQFGSDWGGVSGIVYTAHQHDGFFRATEISPGESIFATVKFFSRAGRTPTPGSCRLQLEILLGKDFSGGFGAATLNNLSAELKAE